MFFLRFIKSRPLITLTILYCAVLTTLNCTGFFISPPKHDVARFISPHYTDITGKVTCISEENSTKQIITIKALSADGRRCRGTLLVYSFSKNNRAEEGDILRFHCVLMRPHPAKNPGGYDQAERLRKMNIYAIAYISSFEKSGREPLSFYTRLAEAAHKDMVETIQKTLPQPEAAVLVPMLVGDKQSLSNEEKDAFTDAGVMHILVVSGLKVAYVAGTFLLLFRIVGFKRRLASLFTIPFLLIYMTATGNNPPVVRATVMALCIFATMSLNRSSITYQALALAAAAILIVDPQALFSASFQLSFAATIGIVYLYPYLIRPFQKFPWWLRNPVGGSIAVSLASQLGVIPLLSLYFHKMFFAGIISNIPIVPLTGIITGMGIVLYMVHFVSGTFASFIAWVTALLIKILLAQVHYFARLPYAAVHVATPNLWIIGAYYFFLVGIVQIRRIKYMPYILAAAGTLILSVSVIRHNTAKERFEITSLYAGNGSVAHVAFPGNVNWLIDCGRENDGKRTVCPYLWSKGIRKIDRIIITSDDKRHSGGLKNVTDNFPSPDIVYPDSVAEQEKYFVNGATVTLSPCSKDSGNLLTLYIDFAGKRMVFAHQEKIPEEVSAGTADVLHISCRGKQPDILSIISGFRAGTIILSGTVPKSMVDIEGVYPLNKCGAVSYAVTPKEIRVKKFIEAQDSGDTYSEE